MSAIRTSQKVRVPEWKTTEKIVTTKGWIPIFLWFGLAGVVGDGQQEKHIIVAWQISANVPSCSGHHGHSCSVKQLHRGPSIWHFVTLLEWVSTQKAQRCDCVLGRHSTSMGTAGEPWGQIPLTLRWYPGLVPVIALEALWPGAFLSYQ